MLLPCVVPTITGVEMSLPFSFFLFGILPTTTMPSLCEESFYWSCDKKQNKPPPPKKKRFPQELTALSSCVCDGIGVARLLLDYGTDINTHSNEFKESALTLACYKGHLEMVKFLLGAGVFSYLVL